MALRIGWFSTGRDPAARNLLEAVHSDVSAKRVPASIDWIFCHRETGDSPADEESRQREEFFGLAARLEIPVATFSHVRFMPELRKQGLKESAGAAEASAALEQWRNLYGQEVVKILDMLQPVDVVVLAGYMLILGAPELERLDAVNLHPALPWGPKGTWQEVIHQLIAEEASEQGIMIHLVTGMLDRGPVISYCRFPIRGEGWEDLWRQWHDEIALDRPREDREQNALFRRIRREGEIRELPLLRSVIRELAYGNITIQDKKVRAGGQIVEEGVDLTASIEEIVAG